jgi:hypothetical protein
MNCTFGERLRVVIIFSIALMAFMEKYFAHLLALQITSASSS